MKNKYKIALIVIGILILGTSYIGLTYSLWIKTFESTETNTIRSGCFTIQFTEKTHSISLKNTYPVTDATALEKVKPYQIEIKNTCDTTDAGYAITLNTVEVAGTKLDDSKVKVAVGVNNVKPTMGTLLSTNEVNTELENITPKLNGTLVTSYIINTGYIEKNASKTFELYLWMDENATTADANKVFQAGIVVTTYATKMDTLANTIQSEVNTRSNNGVIAVSHTDSSLTNEALKQTEYRYIGNDPNNYLSFNNELWRMIGLVNTPEGQRVKIIRNNILSEIANMNSANNNNWNNAELQTYYSNSYYNSINSTYQNFIDPITWNLGSPANYDNASGSVTNFYDAERSENVFAGNSPTWRGQIGLMSPSDYGYATSGGATTVRNVCLASALTTYGTLSDCINNNWLYNSGKTMWTMIPSSTTSENYFVINSSGSLEEQNSNNTFADRPALYLKTGISIKGGNGTAGNPYIIG